MNPKQRQQFRKLFSSLISICLLLPVILLPVSAEETDHGSMPAPSSLYGATMMVIGDSITAREGLEEDDSSWTDLLVENHNMGIYCNSVSGSTIGWSPDVEKSKWPMCFRPLPDYDFDIIFIQGGINDWRFEIPLGEDHSSMDLSTTIGGLNHLLDRVQEAYPNALILYMTPWESDGRENVYGITLDDYSQTIYDLCKSRGVICFYAMDPTVSGISMDSDFRAKYFIDNDPYHMNETGHALFYPVIASWLEEQMNIPLEQYRIAEAQAAYARWQKFIKTRAKGAMCRGNVNTL